MAFRTSGREEGNGTGVKDELQPEELDKIISECLDGDELPGAVPDEELEQICSEGLDVDELPEIDPEDYPLPELPEMDLDKWLSDFD